MASVNDYLKKLLYQYDCVVVSELGAFLTHYQPASFAETSGLYLPPRKRVAFNEALRLDDGILANYIMLHEPLTREGAQRHISQFVTLLRQQVDQTGRFELDGIGTFTRNDEGRLQFDPSLRHNFFGEAYGMSAISAQLVGKEAEGQPAIDAVPVTAIGPHIPQEELVSVEPLPVRRSYWRIAAAALLIGSLGLFSYSSVVKEGQSQQSSLTPSNLFRLPASFLDRSTADNAPTTSATPVSSPQVRTTTASTPAVESKPVAEPVVVAETKKDFIEEKQVASAPAVLINAAAKPVRKLPHYTVIAGSFSNKRNALRFRKQLKKSGYTDAYVIMPEQKGQLYKVAAAGSAVREEAVAQMNAIGKVAGTEPWLFTN